MLSSQIIIISNENTYVFGFFHENQKPQMLTHTDNKYDFSIDYPNNWEKSVKINNEVIFIAPKERDSVSSPAGVVIKVIPRMAGNISIDSAAKLLMSEIKSEHKDFNLEFTNPYNIDGKKAIQTVFTATDSKLQNRKAMQILTANNDNIFIITYKASTDKYPSYEKIANDMISSIKFITK